VILIKLIVLLDAIDLTSRPKQLALSVDLIPGPSVADVVRSQNETIAVGISTGGHAAGLAAELVVAERLRGTACIGLRHQLPETVVGEAPRTHVRVVQRGPVTDSVVG